MAETNVSYSEANKSHPTLGKSYSNVVTSSPSNKASYKKTILLKPRPPPPPRKGYDKAAHRALFNEEVPPSHNGTALNNPHASSPSETLTALLIQLVSAVSKSFSPSLMSHVAPLISTIISSFNNGSSDLTMEHSEYS
jgi:hypothetical protein